MRPITPLFLATALALSAGALLAAEPAQQAYRCGNSYSQFPCPNGKTVDTADARSKDQKAQADAVNQKTGRMADAMEKSRLQREAAQRKAALKEIDKSAASSVNKPAPEKKPAKATTAQKKKKGEPENFTAKTPGDKKKKAGADKQASNGTSAGNSGNPNSTSR